MDLAHDPELRAAAMAARSWGVPLSVFLGRPAPVVTHHVYDDAGRLVLSEAHGPVWTPQDRDVALALADWEAGQCGGCGGQLAETTDRDNEFAWRAGDAIRCHRCTAQAIASEKYRESQHPQALLIPLVRRDEQPAEQDAS